MEFEKLPIILLNLVVLSFVVWRFVLRGFIGWRRLSEYYRCQTKFEGRMWHWQTARLLISYNNILTIGSNAYGLYLALTPLPSIGSSFFGHPSLLIPWSEITITEQRKFLRSFMIFSFAQSPTITFQVSLSQGERILAERNGT